MTLAERAEALVRGVVDPLIVGGPLELQRPFGPKLALALGEVASLDDSLIDGARLRVARSVVAIDAIAPMGPSEFALAAALNDLMQITNHELSGFATRGRHPELLDAVAALVTAMPACRNLAEVVGRHATFSRALEVVRTDTEVSWWTGSASFRGRPAPARLLAWPDLRNVQARTQQIPLAEMAGGADIDGEDFTAGLSAWLACSPLSDLATAHRQSPGFHWSRHTVALVATVGGSNLALRAIRAATDEHAQAVGRTIDALRSAGADLGDGRAGKIAIRFGKCLEQAQAQWSAIA